MHTTSPSKPVETSLEETVFRIVLSRPEKRNALSLDTMDAISEALDEADSSRARVIVISALGAVFSSGHDLKEITHARTNDDNGRAFFAHTMNTCSAMMQKIVNHRLPVIAQVEGVATAAGCQMVASCDLAVAADTAKFITPGVNIGLFCSTPMVALSRNVSNKHALEMLLTGEVCDAQKAAEIGLVNRAVPADQVEPTVQWFADRIAAKSQATVRTGKQAFYKQTQMPLDEAYAYCSRVMVENLLYRDAEEGINAFLEKRDPAWQDQ